MIPTWLELRIALRTLRRSKAFATFSILALALAIAANTTMSSLLDAIVHPDVSFSHPERLVIAEFHGSPWNVTPGSASRLPRATLLDVLGTSGRTYAAAANWLSNGPKTDVFLQAGGGRTGARVVYAAPNYFATIGAHPLYGTLFRPEATTTDQLAVISEDVWRRLTGGQKAFAPFDVNMQFSYGGSAAFTVIGVLPRNGAIPLDAGIFLVSRGYVETALLRLRAGVTDAQALVELNALAPRVDRLHSRLAHFTLQPAVVSQASHLDLVAALAAATLAVLLIACANIANLLVARGMARTRELATRLALGASRSQVARLLFAESGFVALAGGALGMVLALWTIHLLSATLPANLQYLGLVQPQLSWRVVAAGVGLTGAAAVVFGVAPMVALMRAEVGVLIKGAAGRHTPAGRTNFRLLVVAEIAGALTLVVSASMLGAVTGRIQFVDYGYDATNLLMARAPEAQLMRGNADHYGRAAEPAVVTKRYDELQRLRALPGVVAVTAEWPTGGGNIRVDDPGRRVPAHQDRGLTHHRRGAQLPSRARNDRDPRA